jgi:phospholipid/cholesterol/gamma-HCH transport system permease protein
MRPLARLALAVLGAPVRALEGLGEVLVLFADVCFWGFRRPFRAVVFFEALEFVGVGSILIIVLVGTFTGMVVGLQGVEAMRRVNAESFVGSGVALSLCRELSPVLTALMITGRAASAMATELGSMRITEQIDALHTMAVNPVQYLVVPRVFAGLVMVPLMAMLFTVVGMLGAYGVAVWYKGVDPGQFWANVEWYTDPSDIVQGLIKAAVFGLTLALIGCYQGYNAGGGAKGVGLATTRAVVVASVAILVMDYFLTDIIIALTPA